jgi:AraC-like DNA-binding protein
MSLLHAGQRAADVAFALGYADQAHMTNSLRQIMGQTPGQIAGSVAA